MPMNPRAKRWLKWTALAVAGLILLLLLLLAGAVLALNTQWGRDTVVSLVNEKASSETMTIRLEGLESVMPWDLRLGAFSLADPEGVWLSGSNLDVSLDVGALLDGAVTLDHILLEEVAYLRPPAGSEEPPKPEPAEPISLEIPSIPPVRIDTLRVDRLLLHLPQEHEAGQADTEPAPQRKAFSIQGAIRPEGQDFVVDLAVDELSEAALEGREPPATFRPDSLQLQARLRQPGNILAIDASLEEGSGGLLGAALGVSPETAVSGGLQGTGALDHWQGDLRLDVGQQHLLTGKLELRLDQQAGTFSAGLNGRVQDPVDLLPPDVTRLSGSHADFDLGVTLPLDGQLARQASVDTLTVSSPTFSLQLAATVHDEELDAQLGLDVLDPDVLQQLAGGSLQGTPRLQATIGGDLDKLVVQLDAGLGALALPELASDPAQLETTVTVTAPLDGAKRSIAATGALAVEGLQPPEQYTLDQRLRIEFDVAMPEQTRIQVRSLSLHNGDNTLAAQGDVNLEALEVQAQLSADLPHAGALMALHPLDAAITLKADASGAMESGIDATLSGSLRRIKGLDPQLAALLGDKLDLAAKVFVSQEKVQLHQLGVDGRTSLAASGEYIMQGQQLDAELAITPPETLALPGEAGGPAALELAGMRRLDITARGSLEKHLQVTASGGASTAVLPDRRFDDLLLDLDAGLPLTPDPEEDSFSLQLSTRQLTIDASSRYRLEGDTLHLRKIDINGPDTSISGSLDLALDSTLADGTIDLQLQRLAAYDQFLGLGLSGALSGKISLSGKNGRQAVTLAATGNDLAAAGASVASLKLDASSASIYGLAQGDGSADLSLNTGRAGVEAAFAEKLQLTAAMRNGVVELDLETNGQADKPFDLALKGSVTPGPQAIKARIASLKGAYAGISLQLKQPVEIASAKGGVSVRGLVLALEGATLRVDGDYGPQTADLDLKLSDLDLQTIKKIDPENLEMPHGSANLDVTVKGDLASPAIDAKVTLANIETPQDGPDDPNFPPVDIALDAALKGGSLNANTVLSHPGGRLATMNVKLPMRLGLQPFAFELKENAPVSGDLEGGFDLTLLQNVLAMTDQVLDGQIAYDVTLDGELNQVDATGTVSLENGRYENLKLGTLLTDLTLQLSATGERFEITKLSAHDGHGGTINGKGGVDLSEDYPFKAEVRIDRFMPANMDIFHGTVSGTVDLVGSAKEGAEVEGRLTVNKAELTIPQSLPPDVANVDVVQKNDGQPEEKEDEEEGEEDGEEDEEPAAFPVTLDVTVDIPGRFFVRGMGLDSEWQGRLSVTGKAASPRMVGTLQVSRGSFSFLEQVFEIQEGKIRFSGATPPSPVMDIITSTQTRNIIAKVIISGTVQHLKITFDSEPPLPQNEILAAVLFGRSLDSLTPLQALRLARALDQLSGGTTGSSLDVMQNLKSVLHVDELSAGEGKSGDMTLQAGKYLTDDVYVKGTKGLDPQDDSLSLEVEITPNLGLESEMGGDSQGGVGLNWRYDY